MACDLVLKQTNSQISQTDESDIIKKRLPLTVESLDARGLYIFDDGFRFVIWFGRSISPDIGRNLLGDDFNGDYSKVDSCTYHFNSLSYI